MSENCNQEDQEQCGRMASSFCQPLVNKAGWQSLKSAFGAASSQRVTLSHQNEPSQPQQAPSEEESAEGDSPRSGNSLLDGMAATSPQDNTFDRPYSSSSMGKSPDGPALSPVLKIGGFPLESPPPTPPRKLERYRTNRIRTHESCQPRNGVHSNKRTRLLVFIKIILKCLDYEDPSLHFEAKQVITDCTRKNREGVPGYDPLADAITRRLHITVGEVHWNRAQNLMIHYMKSRTRNELKFDKQPRYAAV